MGSPVHKELPESESPSRNFTKFRFFDQVADALPVYFL